MRALAACAILSVLVAGCTTPDPAATSTAAPNDGATATSINPEGLVASCMLDASGFADSGSVVVGDGLGDAATLSEIGWESHPGCDRIQIGFLAASGAPASAVGTAVATLTPEAGVIRIQYPDSVVATGPRDVAIDSGLVSAAYVVWTREGRLAVDLHLVGDRAVAFAASTTTAPARSIVDIRPGSDVGAVTSPSTRGEALVLLEPAPGPATYPIRITGYSGAPSGEVTVRLSAGAAVVEQRRTVAAGDGSTWGEFAVVIDDGPTGLATLFVGSEIGGVERGVTIDLDLG